MLYVHGFLMAKPFSSGIKGALMSECLHWFEAYYLYDTEETQVLLSDFIFRSQTRAGYIFLNLISSIRRRIAMWKLDKNIAELCLMV